MIEIRAWSSVTEVQPRDTSAGARRPRDSPAASEADRVEAVAPERRPRPAVVGRLIAALGADRDPGRRGPGHVGAGRAKPGQAPILDGSPRRAPVPADGEVLAGLRLFLVVAADDDAVGGVAERDREDAGGPAGGERRGHGPPRPAAVGGSQDP